MIDRPSVSPCIDLTICSIILLLMMIDQHSFFFQLLEENIICFVKTELKRFKRVLGPDYQEYFGRQKENEEELDKEDEEERSSSREAFLKITLDFLRRMKQEEMADCLQKSKSILGEIGLDTEQEWCSMTKST